MDDNQKEFEEAQESSASREQNRGGEGDALDASAQQGDAGSSLSTPDDSTNPASEAEPPIIVQGG